MNTASQRFAGKVALVTGAASGLGDAFAQRLAKEGAKVVVLDVDVDAGAAVVAMIVAAGGEAFFCRADVTDAGSMADAVAAIVARYGQLDVAVNNAGIGGGIHPIPDFPVADWTRTIMVNLVGVFHSLRAEIPAMAERGGSIVNVASVVGAVAHPFTSAYVASKHGVVGLTKSAALEWAGKNIRVNAVGPTWVKTPLTLGAWEDPDEWDKIAAENPLGRVATPDEIANVVLFLASDDASIITGSLYLADAGYTAK